jgi:choline transport protein
MAEEVAKSSVVVPRSMLLAVVMNGALGFAMLIAFLFSAGNLEQLLEATAEYPFMGIIQSATQSQSAMIVLSTLVSFLQACAGIAAISSGSRMLWSFAREQAIPGWQWIRQVRSSRESKTAGQTLNLIYAFR